MSNHKHAHCSEPSLVAMRGLAPQNSKDPEA